MTTLLHQACNMLETELRRPQMLPVFIADEYLKRSNGARPTAARIDELMDRGLAAMRRSLEESYDLGRHANVASQMAYNAVREKIYQELDQEFQKLIVLA